MRKRNWRARRVPVRSGLPGMCPGLEEKALLAEPSGWGLRLLLVPAPPQLLCLGWFGEELCHWQPRCSRVTVGG